MLFSFGSEAKEYAKRLPEDLDLIVFDASDIGLAYLKAVELRTQGKVFYSQPLFDERTEGNYVRAYSDIAHLSDGIVARSQTELARFSKWTGFYPSRSYILPRSVENYSEADVAVLDCDDPGIALGFGWPALAVSARSGAHEFLDNVAVFDSPEGVYAAKMRALGSPEPVLRSPLPTVKGLRDSIKDAIPSITQGPLVSIVIPTYNRPDQLRQQLHRLKAQTYQNLEIIVINDGGESCDWVFTEFPDVAVVGVIENRGVESALAKGLMMATGEYFGQIADDDPIYPDHVARLVEVLVRTGVLAARTSTLSRFLDSEGRTRGLGLGPWAMTFPKDDYLHGEALAVQSFLFHRKTLIEELGGLYLIRDDLPILTDAEFIMRISQKIDFPHVRSVTVEGVSRGDETNQGYRHIDRIVEYQQRVFGLHPTDDPEVKRKRGLVLAGLQARVQNGTFISHHEQPTVTIGAAS